MAKIIFDHVTHKFSSGAVALDDVSCTIDHGEFVFLVGPSGSGKTTFVRLLIRELLPTEGKITLDGEEISQKRGVSVPKLRRKIGVAFQDVKLLGDRTVKENIAMALEILGKKKEDIEKSVDAALDLVGLDDVSELFPSQLSGGQLQRVGIARAVVGDPEIIFADEPTANLDEETGWKIASLLKEINRKGKTIILSTHNLDLVNSMGEKVLALNKGKLKNIPKKDK